MLAKHGSEKDRNIKNTLARTKLYNTKYLTVIFTLTLTAPFK